MNFLGKIFTVIIFVLSVMFMAFSIMVFATHRNWREHAQGLQQQLTNQQNTNQALVAEVTRIEEALTREQAARQTQVAVLTTSKERALNQLAELQTQNDGLQASLNEAQNANSNAVAELNRLTTEVAQVRTQLNQTKQDRDTLYAQVVSLTNTVNEQRGQKEVLESQYTTLASQNARMKSVLDRNGMTEYDDVSNIPPRINGEVLAVADSGYIEISLGGDDGLKEGHTLEVYRNNQYLGRVVVRRTAPDRAVAQVLTDFRKGIIRKGDRVATRLS